MSSAGISPTAHYTGYVWARNGLSHPALSTAGGRVLFGALQPEMAVSRALGGPTLESFLLARHRLIDHLLAAAIERGEVGQVLEVACGLSPRGWRFARRYDSRITYVEADLPGMAARKRNALARMGSLGTHHRVVDIDALAHDGPQSLHAVTAELDPERGLAIITEGLISYLAPGALASFWQRTARVLARFPHARYLSDVHLAVENRGPGTTAFLRALSVFVRGRVQLHFTDVPDAQRALVDAGFTRTTLHRPSDLADRIPVPGRGGDLVRVIEAECVSAE